MTQGSNRIDRDFMQRDGSVLDAPERTQRTLSPLAALALGAAHELSSPLATIAVAARELERDFTNGDSPHASLSDVRLIRSQVERCRAVLAQLVADASGPHDEPCRDIAIGDLLVQLQEDLMHRGRLRLAIERPLSTRAVRVPVRATLLALRNVVTNGWQAMPVGGEIVIRIVARDRLVAIAVEDSGTGMTPEVLARATEPMFTTKAPNENMGLGLFVTRVVLERIGGGLSFDSLPGRGTNAIIEIPFA